MVERRDLETKDQSTQNFWVNLEALFGKEFYLWLFNQPVLAKEPVWISEQTTHHPQTAVLKYNIGLFLDNKWTFAFSASEFLRKRETNYGWHVTLSFPDFLLRFSSKPSHVLQRDCSTFYLYRQVPKSKEDVSKYLLDGSLLTFMVTPEGVNSTLNYQGFSTDHLPSEEDVRLIADCTEFCDLVKRRREVNLKPPLWPRQITFSLPEIVHYFGPVYGGSPETHKKKVVIPAEKRRFKLL